MTKRNPNQGARMPEATLRADKDVFLLVIHVRFRFQSFDLLTVKVVIFALVA